MRKSSTLGLLPAALLVLALASCDGISPPAQVTFQRTYGGMCSDYGYSVAQTTDGGYVITGIRTSDVYLVKTDAWGDTMWTRTFGGAGRDCGWSVEQATDGGYIITGYTDSFGAEDLDVYLVKTNATGDTMWTRTFGGADYDCGQCVQQTADGGYVIAGYTSSYGAGIEDVWLIKTNASGDTLRTRTYGGTQHDEGYSVAQTADGEYIIVGRTSSFGTDSYNVWLLKTDASGDTVWTRTFGGTRTDGGYSVAQVTDGGYIITGYTSSFGTDGSDAWLIKTDATGDTMWTRTYGGEDSDWGYSVARTANDGYIIAGCTQSFGAGHTDFWLVRIDAWGDTMWTRTFGGADDDFGYSVLQTTDGGYAICGYTDSFGTGYCCDAWLIKTDSAGRVANAEP